MMIDDVIAAVIAYGAWRGTLDRATIALLRLKGYTVRVMSDNTEADLFDVEVS